MVTAYHGHGEYPHRGRSGCAGTKGRPPDPDLLVGGEREGVTSKLSIQRQMGFLPGEGEKGCGGETWGKVFLEEGRTCGKMQR